MGKFTNTIEQYKQDQTSISNALNTKLGGVELYKFSEMADKIREIETKPLANPRLKISNLTSNGEAKPWTGYSIYQNNSNVKDIKEPSCVVELIYGNGFYVIQPRGSETKYHAHVEVTENKVYSINADDFIYSDSHPLVD